MRYSEKGRLAHQHPGNLFAADLHVLSKTEQDSASPEMASEFGLAQKDVKSLKKYLHQS
ncbi:hypothetical protein [Metabacillus sp. 84]|uniref:hypothetical protein n=1 Tax=unclassified Metabacillus TaxID=2675274 RepID=UPI003CF3CE4F